LYTVNPGGLSVEWVNFFRGLRFCSQVHTPSPDHPSPREENNDDGYWELGDRPTTKHPLVGGRPITKHPLANP